MSVCQLKIEYLGHFFFSEDGVEADVEKVQAMVEWSVLKNIKELRGFLGLTGYYRRFVQNYGTIAALLTQLLKKAAFLWSEVEQEAFEILKRAMITLSVLALSDFSMPFTVQTDASGTGLGASARAKCIYERELMAIVLAVQRWMPYLLRQKFLVRTDQRALKYLLEQRVIQPRYQMWLVKLFGYPFEVQYHPRPEYPQF